MPTYIGLLNFTEQGVKNVKESPKRAKAFMAQAEKLDAKVKDIYWTMGRYDLVVVVDAPGYQVASRLMLGLGTLGNVRTETLRAFNVEEFEDIIQGL